MNELTTATEIKTAVNAKTDYSNSLTPSATAEYFFSPVVEAASSPKVGISPIRLNNGSQQQSSLYSRSSFGDVWTIALMVMANCKPSDNAEIEKLVKFVGEMQVQIAANKSSYSMCWNGQMVNDPIFDRDKLKADSIFFSVTEFEFEQKRNF